MDRDQQPPAKKPKSTSRKAGAAKSRFPSSKDKTTEDPSGNSFDEIRVVDSIMLKIYSYLPPVDRIRLGQVDKDFLHDERRGRVVGVYGNHAMTIKEALQEVVMYVSVEGHPITIEYKNEVKCWGWLEGLDEALQISIVDSVPFRKKNGFNVEAAANMEFEGFDTAEVVEGLTSVNVFRENNRTKIGHLEAEINELAFKNLGPYNDLFDLMKKHGISTLPFLAKEWHTNEWFEPVTPLTPGRALLIPGADGKLLPILKKCGICLEFKPDVEIDNCGDEICYESEIRCPDCSTKRTCSVCGETNCLNLMENCCVSGCNNLMCQFQTYPGDDIKYPGCYFVMIPRERETDLRNFSSKAEERKYCKTHKPEGAVSLFQLLDIWTEGRGNNLDDT
mmetsp:Transcript_13908/g.35499  ORF Transcript_13908/g.35499 Transcript_13908/m.35499 type:complete len:391 (+) Transcript_13908:320-1492(+)|eukprot:CAMPEP_0174908576 /NCGR_PEP_ID=MMETSP0167-20121228/65261_1 /TAXON_ID=38298 /ORGANISM="Rhodella maculata, Strain CCMP736" /LENGTH=390 /DNA_ID=CAMNT_0016152361 /DNA_START=164 /DNA_END=1336 /DNA_ORIENTATION=+